MITQIIAFLTFFSLAFLIFTLITHSNAYYFNTILKVPEENFAYIISKRLQKKYDFFNKRRIGVYKFKYKNDEGLDISLKINGSDKNSEIKLLYDNFEIASWIVSVIDDIFYEIKCNELKIKSKVLFNSENVEVNKLIP